ncbi:unnamed protein product [Amaranthus hypochondriacus]
MFPFQSGELSFQVSNNLENNTNTNTNTNFLHQSYEHAQIPLNSNFKSPKTRKQRSNKISHENADCNNKGNGEDGICGNDVISKKKIIHREVERQRRQEMSTLHSSLRSLLPMEYIRGKRSICDHVTEATRYIKDLEKNVKDLGEKREKLKKSFSSLENQFIGNNLRDYNVGCSSSSSTTTSISRSSSSTMSDYNVSVHKFTRTLQIEITAGVADEDPYPLSKTLHFLAQEGLDVVSCVSSMVNQRWIYVIYCEVDETKNVDSVQLQEKLMSGITSCDS